MPLFLFVVSVWVSGGAALSGLWGTFSLSVVAMGLSVYLAGKVKH
jgi:hypothetical protein